MSVRGSIVTDPTVSQDATEPFLRLPDSARLHAHRAARFRHLAEASPMADYLRFLAGVSAAQGAALSGLPPPPPLEAARLRRLLDHGMPLYGRNDTARGETWLHALDALLRRLGDAAMPDAARAALEGFGRMDAAARDALAGRVLGGALGPHELAPALYAGAALQVYWIWLGAGIDPTPLAPMNPAWLCPICGSPPLCSVIDAPGLPGRTRYLHCSLCDAEWRYTRAKCAECGADAGIAYHGLEGQDGPARAETCDSCHGYVKILSYEKDAGIDPLADDLASLGLDIKVSEAGWHRAAANLFLLAG